MNKSLVALVLGLFIAFTNAFPRPEFEMVYTGNNGLALGVAPVKYLPQTMDDLEGESTKWKKYRKYGYGYGHGYRQYNPYYSW